MQPSTLSLSAASMQNSGVYSTALLLPFMTTNKGLPISLPSVAWSKTQQNRVTKYLEDESSLLPCSHTTVAHWSALPVSKLRSCMILAWPERYLCGEVQLTLKEEALTLWGVSNELIRLGDQRLSRGGWSWRHRWHGTRHRWYGTWQDPMLLCWQMGIIWSSKWRDAKCHFAHVFFSLSNLLQIKIS